VRVALTFDTEHPSHPCPPDAGERIIETLAAAGMRATFFLQGRWVSAYPARGRRIVEGGHLVGNHSHQHARMNDLTDDGFRRDVASAEQTIRSVVGVDPKPWFRCPFGAGMDDPRVLSLLGDLGYRHVGWDVDPRDWDEGRTTEELIRRVLEGVRARDESVVLLHSWPAVTADGLPAIIAALRGEGADLIDVSALSAAERTPPAPPIDSVG
jgi:peptidoglycan/xylan/chitin deacetylase (PgdA/CDA1 family)